MAIIAFVIYRCARKDPPSFFQLACLTNLSLGNLANCIDQYKSAVDFTFQCTNTNYILISCEYFFLFNVNFVVSYKFYCATSDLMAFALHKHLPSEKTKKVKRVVYVTIWAFSSGLFLFYLIYSSVLVRENSIDAFLNLNFACFVICSFFILVQTFLFSLSFRNIR